MTTTEQGIAGLDRIAQIKLPVTDLARSIGFYRDLLGLRQFSEFTEDGVVRGAGLIDPQERFCIALRDREVCAGTPSLDGFDVVAFLPATRSVLEEIMARCEHFGFPYASPRGTPAGTMLDVPDPDGTVLPFYHYTVGTDGFTGIESRDGAIVGTYAEPRLVVT